MDITPLEATKLIILIGVPIMVTRMVVSQSRPKRTHRIWTQGLPTLALLILTVRITITQNLDHLAPADEWISTVSWAVVYGAQALAIGYQWLPRELVDVVRRRNPRHGAPG